MWEGRTFVSLAMSPGTREEVGIDLFHRRCLIVFSRLSLFKKSTAGRMK
jgi:hypothetical protein